jgi:hypothetical protein
MFQTAGVVTAKSTGALVALISLVGIRPDSRTGSRIMLDKAKNAIAAMRSIAKRPRNTVIQSVSPLSENGLLIRSAHFNEEYIHQLGFPDFSAK